MNTWKIRRVLDAFDRDGRVEFRSKEDRDGPWKETLQPLWNFDEFDYRPCVRLPTYSFAQVVKIMYDDVVHFYPLVEDLDFSKPETFRLQLDNLISDVAQKMGLQGGDEDHENVYNAICSFRPEIADYLAATTDQADAD